MSHKIRKTDAEWRAQLTPEQYRICRQKGTEPAFTGAYHLTGDLMLLADTMPFT